jgi:hypothetical protein
MIIFQAASLQARYRLCRFGSLRKLRRGQTELKRREMPGFLKKLKTMAGRCGRVLT